jgi:hypothetical protein
MIQLSLNLDQPPVPSAPCTVCHGTVSTCRCCLVIKIWGLSTRCLLFFNLRIPPKKCYHHTLFHFTPKHKRVNMASVNSKINTASRIGSECASNTLVMTAIVSQTRKPVHVLIPHASGFLVEVSMKNLSEVIPVRLTKEDFDLLHTISEDIDIKPGQLARYAIRKMLHEKLKECVQGGH